MAALVGLAALGLGLSGGEDRGPVGGVPAAAARVPDAAPSTRLIAATSKATTSSLAPKAPAWTARPLRSRPASQLESTRTNPLRVDGFSRASVGGAPDASTSYAPLTSFSRSLAAVSAIRSDEFNDPSLDTSIWTFVDPVGDATQTMSGTQALIGVPAGVMHDLWTNVDRVPRLLQPAPDSDFEVEVKWDSAVTAQYQQQGILVVQDADDMLRIETHYEGKGARLFIARIAAGTASVIDSGNIPNGAPVYFRLKRAGNTWSLRTSQNGKNWALRSSFTQALAVTAIGPFAGNAGAPPPAFTSKIDYFRNLAAPADTTPPVISGVSATPNAIGATVTWQTNEPASSTVAYGATSSYGFLAGDATLTASHSVSVSGLACETQYHFQVRSRDEFGNESSSADQTFTTSSCAAGITSDEFNSTSLDTSLWSVVDPVGDVGLTMSGSHAELVVPAGTRHDLWTNADEVPRLLQAAPNSDFEVETKWSSAVGSAYQLQGLLVVQDADDMLRIETHHDGTATRLFVARIAGGSASTVHYSTVAGGAPVYFRLKRTGNDWRLSLSADGAAWTTAATFTQALAVTAIGPFAGNSGNPPPAFTSRIDYFRNIPPDTTPPVLSAISATPGPIGAEVRWTTDEPSTSRVDHGKTASYGTTVSRDDLTVDHRVTLTGLACATTYHYEIRSTDSSGNEARSGDRTLTTAACPASMTSDEFNSGSLDPTRWVVIDPLGDAGVSASATQAVISVPQGTRHDLWAGVDEVPRIMQATPDDDFEVEVKFDSSVTSRYQMQGLLIQQDAGNLLRIEVHHEGSGAYLFIAGLTGGSASTIHEGAVSGDAPVFLRVKRKGSSWTVRHSSDGDSWTATSFTRALAVSAVGPFAGNSGNEPPAFTALVDYFRYIPPDRTPPQISGVSVTRWPMAAEVTWTTDEPATATVAYGTTSSYGATASVPGERRTHRVFLHGLTCETSYHFQLRSADAEGNVGTTADATFVTEACPTELTSDEFNAASLDTDLWAFFDPLDDADVTANGSQAVISVPAGVAHDVWTSSDTVPRLLQAAPDGDFEIEVKFDSAVTTRYQQQGIIVEQDPGTLLRFEIHSEGTETKLFVAAISPGSASIKFDAAVPAGANSYLQVKRAGSSWTVRYSTDGETWPTAVRFDHPFSATAIGPYAGNGGNSPPAFSAKVDYFRVVPPPPPDLTPPAVTSVAALTHRTSATITWSTDELASSSVQWGATSAYGQAPVAAGELTAHRARLTGLTCATTYHYRVRSTDAAGNEAVGTDRTFTTQPCASGPSIAVWRGSPQVFGAVGVPQRWINVLGNVEDPDGIDLLSYRLNAGQSSTLSIGPSDDRLAYAGDFNIELFYGDLRPGLNDVEITAIDTAGNPTVRQVQVDWRGNTNTQPPANGPVLVVVAHPDDEALGMAGVISRAKAAGRRVYVAIVTNGDSNAPGSETGYCGAADGTPAAAAAHGLRRNGETLSALDLLGLQWSPDLASTEIVFLGYPDGRLVDIAASGTGWEGDATGLHRTYAEDSDGSIATCNGDLRYLLEGRHSELSAPALAADLEALLNLTKPSDVYTHAGFDGHTDHAKVSSSLVSAIVRKGLNVRVHSTLIHPEESGSCQAHAAAVWPNPALEDNDPFARFTPTEGFTAPPAPLCDPGATGSSWGSEGAPDELVEVPAAMQALTEASNLKWQVIARYASQVNCTQIGGEYHVNCGYMRAFVKRHEFFWTRLYSPLKTWPRPYTAHFDSIASIESKSQIFEGQWTFDGNGARPVSTGFDRVITLGDMGWTDYEVSAQLIFNSFDQSRPTVGSAAGLALGWQGHSDWGQPRFGHPSGGLCLYAWDTADPLFFKLQLGYSPGPAHDTVLAKQFTDYPLGVPHTMRFRERDLGNGTTRYSCKVWRSDAPEPGAWTLEADIPHWEGESGTHPGSVVLVAHHADVTFQDVTLTPLGD